MSDQHTEPRDAARPPIAARAAFQAELDRLRVREKAHTREGDAIAAALRRLPMVEVDPQTPLTGADGPVPLIDVFDGRSQLVAYFHMWHPGRPAAEQCEGCTFNTSHVTELNYLHSRDVSYAVFGEGSHEEISRYRDFMGYPAPWYSVPQDSVDRLLAGRHFGVLACYLRDGDRVFETYWTTGRGDEVMAPSYALLDRTVYGRQEIWEDSPEGWPQRWGSQGGQFRLDGVRPRSGRGSGPGATTTSAPCRKVGPRARARCTPDHCPGRFDNRWNARCRGRILRCVQGFAEDRFAPVRTVFEDGLASGADVGASVCVNVDGETVVDLWGGFADAARTRPWQRDTIVTVYSVTKTITALTALLLADRGELDPAAPVSRYWPAFAANGKRDVTVAHLLSHSSGLSGWAQPIETTDLYDWDRATGLLAAQAPFWPPGSASGYHVVTQGYLVGEVVRRITGRTLGTVFRQEIAEPLGVDFHIGLPVGADARVADLIAPATESATIAHPTQLQANASTNPPLDVATANSLAWRRAEIPAANGIGNARAVATVLAVLACGGVAGGRRLLSEAGCRRALEVQVEGRDLILDLPLRFGLGFAVSGGMMPNPNTLYWGGLSGSLVIVDLDARTTFAYVPNRVADTMTDVRGLGLAMAMWEAMALI